MATEGASGVARNAACPCGSGLKFKRCCMLREGEQSATVPGLTALATHARLLDACYGPHWRTDWQRSAAFRHHMRLCLNRLGMFLCMVWQELEPALAAARAKAGDCGGIALPNIQSVKLFDCRTVALLTGFQGPSGKLDLSLVIDEQLEAAAMRTWGRFPQDLAREVRATLGLLRRGRWVIARLLQAQARTDTSENKEAGALAPKSATLASLVDTIKSGLPEGLLKTFPSARAQFSMHELLALGDISQTLADSLEDADKLQHFPLLMCESMDRQARPESSDPQPVNWGEDSFYGRHSTGVAAIGSTGLRFVVEACGVPLIMCKDGLSDLNPVTHDLLLTPRTGPIGLEPEQDSQRSNAHIMLTELLHPERAKRKTLNAVLFRENPVDCNTFRTLAVLLDRIITDIYDSGGSNTAGRRAQAVVAKLREEKAESCALFASALGIEREQIPQMLAWGKTLHHRFRRHQDGDLYWGPISESDFCRALNPDLWKLHLSLKRGQAAGTKGRGTATRSWRMQRTISWDKSSRGGAEADPDLPLQDTLRLCQRLQNFIDDQLKMRNLGIKVRVTPDLRDTAKVLFADLTAQTLHISKHTFKCPWVNVQHLALAGVCHFVAQSYREQGVADDKAYQLAWKRMCLQSAYRSKSVDWNETPLDWFQREEDLTDDERRFLQKINRLLALGQSANEHEATLAIERAEELMRQRNIKASAFSRNRETDDLIDSFDRLTLYLGTSKLSSIITKLVGILVRFYSVKVVHMQVPQKFTNEDEQAIMLLGRRESLMVAEHVFDYLHDQIERLWQSTRKGGTLKHADKLSYQLGLLNGFSQKMAAREIERKAKQKGGLENQQAHADDEQLIHLHQQDLNDYKNQVFPKLSSLGVRRTNLRQKAYQEGTTEGSALDVKSAIGAKNETSGSARSLLT